jgi:hypothetical protein
MKKDKEIMDLPGYHYMARNWKELQEFLRINGDPLYTMEGNMKLQSEEVYELGNLLSVDGYLDLEGTPITSLGKLESVGLSLYLGHTKITSLGNLQSVGGYLHLQRTEIVSLGNLKSVGGSLFISRTPLSKKYTEEEIRKMVDVKGKIYLD